MRLLSPRRTVCPYASTLLYAYQRLPRHNDTRRQESNNSVWAETRWARTVSAYTIIRVYPCTSLRVSGHDLFKSGLATIRVYLYSMIILHAETPNRSYADARNFIRNAEGRLRKDDTCLLLRCGSPGEGQAHAHPRHGPAGNNIEYGEAILVALKLKAERQLEVIAPDQQDNLLVLCRLMLDIQAVQEKLSRERWRISVCR
jgi:hypothetical protein